MWNSAERAAPAKRECLPVNLGALRETGWVVGGPKRERGPRGDEALYLAEEEEKARHLPARFVPTGVPNVPPRGYSAIGTFPPSARLSQPVRATSRFSGLPYEVRQLNLLRRNGLCFRTMQVRAGATALLEVFG